MEIAPEERLARRNVPVLFSRETFCRGACGKRLKFCGFPRAGLKARAARFRNFQVAWRGNGVKWPRNAGEIARKWQEIDVFFLFFSRAVGSESCTTWAGGPAYWPARRRRGGIGLKFFGGRRRRAAVKLKI
ncbi:MAG TPA: hypothetical protein VMU18_03955 [Rhodoblastus sp.]|nr:hypothetical protein [Rhodoblastus sp.]